MTVVNLFGAPGAGKSTGAAYIFAKLKMAGINAELVTEFAKDKVWEEAQEPFKNQAYIFGQQFFRISRCNNKVDVIITDSPLLLSVLYNQNPELKEAFNKTVIDVFSSYDNMNYYVRRVKPYNPVGRIHTEEESNAIAPKICEILKENNIDFESVNGDIESYDKIVDSIIQRVNQKNSDYAEFTTVMHDFIERTIWDNIDFSRYVNDIGSLAGVPLVDDIATLLADSFYKHKV